MKIHFAIMYSTSLSYLSQSIFTFYVHILAQIKAQSLKFYSGFFPRLKATRFAQCTSSFFEGQDLSNKWWFSGPIVNWYIFVWAQGLV